MDLQTLTKPRLFGDDATEALRGFIFGGRFGPVQVPRGIDRALVAEFLIEVLEADSSPSAFHRALDTMCFYELGEIVQHIVQRLKNPLENLEEIERAAFVAQIGAEFGPDDMPERASLYLDQTVIANTLNGQETIPTLIDARVALAPLGNLDAVRARLDAEIATAEAAVSDEETLMAYDALVGIRNNQLVRAEHVIERKASILAMDDEARIAELVPIYMSLGDISDGHTEPWAGRLLRRYVLDNNTEASEAIVAAFSNYVAPFTADSELDPSQCFLFERAAEAIAYLEGGLGDEHTALLQRVRPAGVHFLCDASDPLAFM